MFKKAVISIALVIMLSTVTLCFVDNTSDGSSNEKVVVFPNGIKMTFDSEIIYPYVNYISSNDTENKMTLTKSQTLSNAYEYTSFYAISEFRYCIKINNVDMTKPTALKSNNNLCSETFVCPISNYESFDISLTVSDRNFRIFYMENDIITPINTTTTIGNNFNVDRQPVINGDKGIWNTSADGSGIDVLPGTNTATESFLDSISEVNGDYGFILYPKEAGKITVNFNLNGGNGEFAPIKTPAWNNFILPNAVPAKNGFTFDGWKFGNNTYSAESEMELKGDDCTLTAIWKANETPADDASGDGASGGTSDSGTSNGSTPSGGSSENGSSDGSPSGESYANVFSISVYESIEADAPYCVIKSNEELPFLTRDGYDFAGWVTNDGRDFSIDELNGDVSIYGTWKAAEKNAEKPSDGDAAPKINTEDTIAIALSVAAAFLAVLLIKMLYPFLKR